MKQMYGIDLSKEKFDVNFLDQKGAVKQQEVKNKYDSICEFLLKLQKESALCIEHTGVYGDLLVFIANCMDVTIYAVSGYEIKHSLGLQKGKSDAIDALRIREYAERFPDKLIAARHTEEDMHELRELHSLRQSLVKTRKILLTQQKEKDRMHLESIKTHSIATQTITHLSSQIYAVEQEIQKVIDANPAYARSNKLVRSISGVGPVTTNEMIIKTDNFQKIDTARKAASFAGICPFPNSSGKMVKKSRISSMGDRSLKTLFYLCATSSIQYNKEMKMYYNRKKAEGKPSYLVLNNVANKLLRTIYAIIESGEMYDINYLCQDPRLIEKKVA
jgi:transposase